MTETEIIKSENARLRAENEGLKGILNSALEMLCYFNQERNKTIKEHIESYKDGEEYGEIKHWHIVKDKEKHPNKYGEYLVITKIEDDVMTNYLIYNEKEGWYDVDGSNYTYEILAWLDTDYPPCIQNLLKGETDRDEEFDK